MALDGRAVQALLGVHALGQFAGALQLNVRHQTACTGVGQRKDAAHALHRLVHNRQTQPRTRRRRAGGVPPEEGLGEVGELLGWHASAMVTQFQQHPVLAAFGGNLHTGHAGVGRLAVAAGVFQQVRNHPCQFHLIGQHVQVFRDVHGDLQLPVVLHGVHAGRHHGVQVHRRERDMVGAGVVQELVDGGVELNDVGHHVFAGDVVHHAHFGLEPQARQGRAQVVRNAGQHHRAVLFQLGQLLGHAVEADVHLADFAGHHLFVQVAGGEVSVFDAVGGVRQLLERAVDQPRNRRSPGQRQRPGGDEPNEPGAPARRAEA